MYRLPNEMANDLDLGGGPLRIARPTAESHQKVINSHVRK